MNELIIGRQAVLEALKSGTSVEKVVLAFGTRGSALQHIRHLARERGIPVSELDRKHFSTLCQDANAQGVAAVIAAKVYVEVDAILGIAQKRGEPAFIVVLDEIEDPHNLGALIRTAECAGAHGVIIPKHHSASVNQTVAKTSAGASLHIPIAKVTNIAQTLDELKQAGVWIVAADMGGDRLHYEMDYTGAVAIVVGSEGKGIRHLVRKKCDFVVKIPLYGRIESLNASVAGSLIFYEVAKARHGGKEQERKTKPD